MDWAKAAAAARPSTSAVMTANVLMIQLLGMSELRWSLRLLPG
jgi:hypothetical protein